MYNDIILTMVDNAQHKTKPATKTKDEWDKIREKAEKDLERAEKELEEQEPSDEEIIQVQEAIRTQKQLEYQKRLEDDATQEQYIEKLTSTKTSVEEEKKLAEEAEKISQLYAIDMWKRVFSKVSFCNEIPIKIAFHYHLGQRLKFLTIPLAAGAYLDWRINACIIQNSGCLDKNTKIRTSKGIKKLKNLPESFDVESYNFDTKQIELKSATKIYSGKKRLFKITLENGQYCYVNASKDHTFFNENNQEISLENLKVGDKILIDRTKRLPSQHYKNIMHESAVKRWENKEWVEKEMQRRKEQKERPQGYADSIFKDRKGQTLEQLHGEKKASEIKEKLVKDGKENNRMWKPHAKEKHSKIMKELHANGKIPHFKKGKENISYGKAMYPKPVYHEDLKHYTRSSWEENIARTLVNNNIEYSYESTTFENKFKEKEESYTPDFETQKCFIEVKGPIFDWQIEKYLRFKNIIENKKKYILLVAKEYVEKLEKLGLETYDIHEQDIWLRVISNA